MYVNEMLMDLGRNIFNQLSTSANMAIIMFLI